MPNVSGTVDNEHRRASLQVTPALSGLRIRAVMKRRGLSQTAVSKFVGVSQVAISRWCAGLDVPTEENLTGLAAALGMPPDFISSYRPEVVAALTRAKRPGEFLTDAEDAADREAERVSLEVKDAPRREAEWRKEAARKHAALRHRHAESIRIATLQTKTALDREEQSYRNRMASIGNRCIICKTPLRFPGLCADCASGRRPEE
jgi:transcriptional regulator with XRE-family HTH domain